MPSEPFLDVTKLDLERVLTPKEEILEVLRHRGRFAMLDAILARDVEANLIVGIKAIHSSDWWAPDHIPGRPIFPGVLQIETAAQLCSYDYLLRHQGEEKPFIGFAGVDGVRFRGIVEPDVRMVFAGRLARMRSGFFTYDAQGFVDGQLVFEARVLGAVV
jgi:3-hydroxyacyl-[acyl-carrier-protein] dehydratase